RGPAGARTGAGPGGAGWGRPRCPAAPGWPAAGSAAPAAPRAAPAARHGGGGHRAGDEGLAARHGGDNAAMLHVILHQPEIPPNTGNVIRLCANTGAELHLVRPLGFDLDDAKLRRAGLDYHEWARLRVHDSLAQCLAAIGNPRVFAFSARSGVGLQQARFRAGDALLFGGETSGLPEAVLARFPASQRLCLPMRPGQRSLNLSNAVAVAVFEAWRQLGYAGAAGHD